MSSQYSFDQKSYSQARRGLRRLTAETLEDRRMMTVTYHGGAVLPHVEVQGVYYGQDWYNNGALYNQAGQMEGFLNTLVRGSYMDMLTNVGYGVGRGTQDQGRLWLANPNKSQWLTDSGIRGQLQSMIYNGTLKTPDSNRLYVVYVEPGVAILNDHDNSSNSQKDFLGYHGAFAGRDLYGRAADIHYAVIAYPGGYNPTAAADGFRTSFDQMTEVTSHEVTEAVTDPNVNYKYEGWYDDNRNGEIGDLANLKKVYWDGYCVQLEVNAADQLIAPYGWSYYTSYGTFSAPSSRALATVSSNAFANPLTVTQLSVDAKTANVDTTFDLWRDHVPLQDTLVRKHTGNVLLRRVLSPAAADEFFAVFG